MSLVRRLLCHFWGHDWRSSSVHAGIRVCVRCGIALMGAEETR